MKKAIYISILCTVMLTACGNVSESVESAEISAVNQTTVTVTSVRKKRIQAKPQLLHERVRRRYPKLP